MKSTKATLLMVLAVLLLIIHKRLDLLAVVAPVAILVGMIVLRHTGNASVEYRRKR